MNKHAVFDEPFASVPTVEFLGPVEFKEVFLPTDKASGVLTPIAEEWVFNNPAEIYPTLINITTHTGVKKINPEVEEYSARYIFPDLTSIVSVFQNVTAQFSREMLISNLVDSYIVSSERAEDQETKTTIAQAFSDAMRFANSLGHRGAQAQVKFSDYGDLAIQWSTDKGRAIVTFEGDGRYEYTVRRQDGFVPGKERIESPSTVPEDLREYLQEIS